MGFAEISPYNSKANGKVENIHKTVKTMLRAYMKEFKTNWDLLLPLVEFAMNTSRNVNTGYTPFFLRLHNNSQVACSGVSQNVGKKVCNQC